MGYHDGVADDLDETLYRYLNVVRRMPPVVSWTIKISKEISAKSLSPDIKAGMDLFIQRAKAGNDLRPYISTRINNPDCSDLLFYDWGVYHFHLGLNLDTRGFIERTNELLFCIADPSSTSMYLIDVLPHSGSFTNQNMLHIIEENWPQILDRHTLKGVIGLQHHASDQEIAKLRNAGVNVLVQTPGGRVLTSMGGGISTAKTSMMNTMGADWAKKLLRNVESDILAKRHHYEEYFSQHFGKTWDDLHFKLTCFGSILEVTEATTNSVIIKQSLRT